MMEGSGPGGPAPFSILRHGRYLQEYYRQGGSEPNSVDMMRLE